MNNLNFTESGAAVVQAGSPAIVALALYEADGTTPQDLTGRRFSYSVWHPGGSVVADYTAAGEDAVTEGGRTVLKLGPTGDETGAWPLYRVKQTLAWAIYELTAEGPVIWWPANGRPGVYTVEPARDAATAFPIDAGPALDGPYAVISLAGQAGGATVLAVTAQGAPGSIAAATEAATEAATAAALGAIRDGVGSGRDTLAKLSDAVDAADAAEASARAAAIASAVSGLKGSASSAADTLGELEGLISAEASARSAGDTAAIDSAVATIRAGVATAYDTLAKIVAAYQQADAALQASIDALNTATSAALVLKADRSVTISVGGVLQGGGTLAANFSLTVPEASTAEAQAATSGLVISSPRRVKDYLDYIKGAAGGLATLDGSGKIPSSQLPSVAITDTFPVANQAAMLALTAERGDVAIRSDLNKSFILATDDPTQLANWKELLTPTDAVLSVAGRTGAVTLVAADISNLAAGVASFLASPSSANLAAAVTDETGTGALVFANSPTLVTPSADSINITGTSIPANGLYLPAANSLALTAAGSARVEVLSAEFRLRDTLGLSWSSTGLSSPDLFLLRDAANTLALRNAANAQTLRTYNSYTDVSNYERLSIGYASNQLNITHEFAGTGSSRTIRIGTSTIGLFVNQSSTPFTFGGGGSSSGVSKFVEMASYGFIASSGSQTVVAISPSINQSGTAGYDALLINPTELGVGSGAKNLIRCKIGAGTDLFTLDNTGLVSSAGPMKPGSFTVAGVPSASAKGAGATIYVSNESGGAVLAYSDGTNWRRVTDRAVIS